MKTKRSFIIILCLLVVLSNAMVFANVDTHINEETPSLTTEPIADPIPSEPQVTDLIEPEIEPPVMLEMPPLSSDGYVIYYDYNSLLPETISIDLKYDLYHTTIDYVYAKNGYVNIREGPGTYHPIIRSSTIYEKISVLEAVQGEFLEKYAGDMWYKVTWEDDNGIQYGYILSALVELRRYAFDKMLESLYRLEEEVTEQRMGFVSNYKNRSGRAPYYKGRSEDIYGNVRYQSAPGYYSLDDKSEFIYLIDGTLISIIEENENYYHVGTLIHDTTFWVPKRFINFNDSIQLFTQMVIVDRNNQNLTVFEKRETSWVLVSYNLATTGAQSKFKYPTPLGYYMAIEKKPKFLYLDDYTRQISGYAPYSVRFTGGAYIHGVPVNFKKQGGNLIDPGKKEFLSTIGTIPRSHKCVRNYTSHAKFLYEWAKIGELGIIVIE